MKQFNLKYFYIVLSVFIFVLLFQTCLRYEYHVVANGIATLRIDKLTGKTKLIKNIPNKPKQKQEIKRETPSLLDGYKEE